MQLILNEDLTTNNDRIAETIYEYSGQTTDDDTTESVIDGMSIVGEVYEG